MRIQVVADSSANLKNIPEVHFSSVPLTIIAGEKEYRDDESLNVKKFVNELDAYPGKSSTACPGINDWLEAFGNADLVICLTLTGKLSGCYNSAKAAADYYMEDYPERQVFVLDSLSTGPELELLAEKALEYINNDNICDLSLDDAYDKVSSYLSGLSKRTHLSFSLKSVSNFAKNGRVNSHLARAAELLHIHIVGRASAVGDLEPLDKSRGEERAVRQLFSNMKSDGFNGSRVIIRHTFNEKGAEALRDLIKAEFPACEIKIGLNRGLCSYYAEPGSILVGFEA